MSLSELETLRRLRRHRADRAERALREAKRHQRALQAHIEQAEDAISDLGFRQFRVRDHAGLARLEVAPDELAALLAQLGTVGDAMRRVGFEEVCVDLIGYRSGSLNE